jgi:undecaprenyl-diphosphatase
MRKYIEPLWRSWTEFKAKQAIVLLLLTGCVFLVISFAIRRPGVEHIDLSFTKSLQQFQGAWVYAMMLGFTVLGNTLSLIIIGAALAVYLFVRKRPLAGWLTMITLIGLPINMILKDAVGRPRPSTDLVSVLAPTIGLSFPSGHAMASTTLYGYLAVLCWMHIPQRSTRNAAALAFAFTAVMVSVSRVYLGAHWLSDVVGGWTAGLFLLVIIVEIYKHWGKKELAMHKPVPQEPEVVHYVPDPGEIPARGAPGSKPV